MSPISEDIRIFPPDAYEGENRPDEFVMEIDREFNSAINRSVLFSSDTVKRLIEDFPTTADATFAWINQTDNPNRIYHLSAGKINEWFRGHYEGLVSSILPMPADGLPEVDSTEEKSLRKKVLGSAIDYIEQYGDKPLLDTLSDAEISLLRPWRSKFDAGELHGTQERILEIYSALSEKMPGILIENHHPVNSSGVFQLPPRGLAIRWYIVSDDMRLNLSVSQNYRLPSPDSQYFLFLRYLNYLGGFGHIKQSFWEKYAELLKKENLLPFYPEFHYRGHDATAYKKVKEELVKKYHIPEDEFYPIERDFVQLAWDDYAEKKNTVIDNLIFLINVMLKHDHPEYHRYLLKAVKTNIWNIEKYKNEPWQFGFLVNNLQSVLAGDLLFASVFYSYIYLPKEAFNRPPRSTPMKTPRKNLIRALLIDIFGLISSHDVPYPYDKSAEFCNALADKEIYSEESYEPTIDEELGIKDIRRKRREGIRTKGGNQFKAELSRA